MTLLRQLIAAVRRDNKLLFAIACVHVALALIFLMIAPFDHRLVSGIGPWVKPFKFAASIALYSFTLAYLMRWLEDSTFVRRISQGVAASMLIEIVLITLQAARGVRSHFNESTPLDYAIFGAMGVAIVFNTILAAWVGLRFSKPQQRLSGGTLWGIRLGFLLFILGSLEGGVMVANLGHAVGVADGGPGLPLVNWSTQGGDLRIAHFLALHSLQVLPILGWWLDRSPSLSLRRNAGAYVGFAAVVYALTVGALLLQALRGVPLIGI